MRHHGQTGGVQGLQGAVQALLAVGQVINLRIGRRAADDVYQSLVHPCPLELQGRGRVQQTAVHGNKQARFRLHPGHGRQERPPGHAPTAVAAAGKQHAAHALGRQLTATLQQLLGRGHVGHAFEQLPPAVRAALGAAHARDGKGRILAAHAVAHEHARQIKSHTLPETPTGERPGPFQPGVVPDKFLRHRAVGELRSRRRRTPRRGRIPSGLDRLGGLRGQAFSLKGGVRKRHSIP